MRPERAASAPTVHIKGVHPASTDWTAVSQGTSHFIITVALRSMFSPFLCCLEVGHGNRTWQKISMLFRILYPHLDSSKPSEPQEPQTKKMDGAEETQANPHYYRDLFFPEYAQNQKNKAPSKALPTTAVDNDVYANMFTLPDNFESFLEQAPLPDVMPDGTFRTRSSESPSILTPPVSGR
jgi:hypothetical protein